MPKMEAASLTIKISLAQIIDTGNIREVQKYGPNKKGEYPKEIMELAQSIKTLGQLQPVVVKLAREHDGTKQYELIAGFRRRAAFQYLVSTGEDYSMIDAKIVTGDKLTIQLVENIQREDLTDPEKETAIFKLVASGLKQTEIAAQLSKNRSFVSINISAHKIRLIGQEAGIDLSGVATSTLAEFLSVPDEDLPDVLSQLVSLGKTRAAAHAIAETYKRGKEALPPAEPAPGLVPAVPSSGNEPSPDNAADPLANEPQTPEIPTARPEPTGKSDPRPKTPTTPPDEHIEADHRVIDVNEVLTVIYEYIKSTDSTERAEAAKDILALIHKRLDNA